MTDNERQFLLSVKNGNPKWELLEMENLDLIAELPSVKWRLINIAKMSNEKHALAYANLREVLYPDLKNSGSNSLVKNINNLNICIAENL